MVNGDAARSGGWGKTYWLWAIAFGIAGMAAAFVVSMAATPLYEAQTTLYVSTTGGAPVSNASYQESTASQQIALSMAKLIPTEVITEQVVHNMNLAISPAALSSKITAVVEPETVLINLTVTDASPTRAREIANAVALEFSDFVDELVMKKSTSVPKPQVTVIAPAATHPTPVSPNTSRNVGLGLAVGVASGLVLANIRVRSDSTVRSGEELGSVVRQPVLGTVPAWRRHYTASAPGHGADSSVAEAYKEIRTNLRRVLGGSPSRMVAVTSAGAGEGKSATILGIAAALDDVGMRVAVVDADLRGRGLTSLLGLSEQPGLTEYFEQRRNFDEIVHPHVWQRVDAIPAGQRCDHPSELLSSEMAGKMYTLLGERYDYVLIDTPAILTFTDAAVVSDEADGVILVARYGGTTTESLHDAMTGLQQVQAEILGTVLTFAPVPTSHRRALTRTRRIPGG